LTHFLTQRTALHFARKRYSAAAAGVFVQKTRAPSSAGAGIGIDFRMARWRSGTSPRKRPCRTERSEEDASLYDRLLMNGDPDVVEILTLWRWSTLGWRLSSRGPGAAAVRKYFSANLPSRLRSGPPEHLAAMRRGCFHPNHPTRPRRWGIWNWPRLLGMSRLARGLFRVAGLFLRFKAADQYLNAFKGLFLSYPRGHFPVVRYAFVQLFAFFAHGLIVPEGRVIRTATIISYSCSGSCWKASGNCSFRWC